MKEMEEEEGFWEIKEKPINLTNLLPCACQVKLKMAFKIFSLLFKYVLRI